MIFGNVHAFIHVLYSSGDPHNLQCKSARGRNKQEQGGTGNTGSICAQNVTSDSADVAWRRKQITAVSLRNLIILYMRLTISLTMQADDVETERGWMKVVYVCIWYTWLLTSIKHCQPSTGYCRPRHPGSKQTLMDWHPSGQNMHHIHTNQRLGVFHDITSITHLCRPCIQALLQ